ncbi:hypothetical protein KNP414_03113 [Paenibacillus mucilaginosus KNP414]|uniref:Uncharacterized protein n=1 Tax=Paenibacillus mucilaginosus (strain KNP414) TaxID=1036673 RepID=F8FB28_PAEMK|nr:hypothetical protein KNP414_03113 [Paenibacillus mucilaginosus KNP414]
MGVRSMEQEVLWKSLMMNGSIVMFWRQSMLEKYVKHKKRRI